MNGSIIFAYVAVNFNATFLEVLEVELVNFVLEGDLSVVVWVVTFCHPCCFWRTIEEVNGHQRDKAITILFLEMANSRHLAKVLKVEFRQIKFEIKDVLIRVDFSFIWGNWEFALNLKTI